MDSGGIQFLDPRGLVIVLVTLAALLIAVWLILILLGHRRQLGPATVDSVARERGGLDRYLAVADVRPPGPSPVAQQQPGPARGDTGREQADEELRQSEARFRNIFDHTAVGMAHVSPAGRFLRVNLKLAGLLGYRPADFRSMTVEQVSVPEDLARELPYMQEVRAGLRDEYTVEKRYRRKDGSTFWAELTACAMRDEYKRIAYLVGVVMDIDSRKQLEAQVRRSNQLYRTLSETNRAIARSRDVHELLREACTIAVSQAAFSLATVVRCGTAGSAAAVVASAGPDAENFVQELLALQLQQGVTLFSGVEDENTGVVVVNDVETGPVCANARLTCLRRGMRSYATFPLGAPGSLETRLAVFSTEPGFFADDTLEQVANMARDLSLAVDRFAERSARTHAEDRLRDVVQRMSALVDAAPMAVFDIDAEQRVLGVWNPAAEQIFGWRRREVLGRPLPVTPAAAEDEARFAELRRRVGAGEAVAGLEICCRRTDGAVAYLSVSASPVTGISGSPAALLVAEDITARHEASEAMRRARVELEARVHERTIELAVARDRAEEADRIKTAFLANMSQQLRTPLNSIIGFSSLLLSGGPGAINTEQGEQLAIIREAGERLLALIEDVLDISRLQAGNAPLPREPTPLRDMVLRIADTLRPQAIGRGLALETGIGPCVAMAEPRRLEQVITILVSHAIRRTHAGGVKVQCGTYNGVVAIAVEDSGPGISVADQQLLFVPFSSPQEQDAAAGAGLSLAIARRLVEAMGGGIWVASEPGRGSVFTVRLEAADAASGEHADD